LVARFRDLAEVQFDTLSPVFLDWFDTSDALCNRMLVNCINCGLVKPSERSRQALVLCRVVAYGPGLTVQIRTITVLYC
jgi:hypothetical protein